MRFKYWILFFGTSVLLIVYPFIVPSKYFISLLTQILIFSIFIMGLNLIVGYIKLVSVGHAALFGIGAYTATLLANHVSNNIWLGLAAGTLLASFLAAIFALISLRMAGIYFLFITLALGQVVWAIIFGWRSLTKGDDGLSVVGNPKLWGSFSISGSINYYYLSLIFFCLVFFIIYRIVNAPFGHAIVGIRENDSRMRVLGYDVWWHKFVAFIISGAFSGLAGVIWAYYNGFVSPRDASFALSTEALLMVILGGSGTLFGPIMGTIVIITIQNMIVAYTQRWIFVLGLVYVLTVFFFPQGIINNNLLERLKRWI